MDKDFPLKEFVTVCCGGIFFGSLGFYYLLLRPDAMKPEMHMQAVLSRMKDTNPRVLENHEPVMIAKEFGKTLAEAKHLVTADRMENLILNRFGNNANSRSAIRWFENADRMQSVDLSSERETLESHPVESASMFVTTLDQMESPEDFARLVHSFQQLNFQDEEQKQVTDQLLLWAHSKTYAQPNQILRAYDLISFYSKDDATTWITKLKTETQNEELNAFLRTQFPDVPGK